MKKTDTFLKKSVSRRSVLKGGAAIAGVTAVTGFPTVWAQNIKDITLNHTGMSYSTIADIARQATHGPRLQGRDVGRRPSRPDQPHDPGPELDRHRRHRDLADQGRRAAGRHPGGRDREDHDLGQAHAALHRRHVRRQASVAPGRLAVSSSCTATRIDGTTFADGQDRVGDLRARRLQRRHARHPSRPDRPRRSPSWADLLSAGLQGQGRDPEHPDHRHHGRHHGAARPPASSSTATRATRPRTS